MQKVKVGIIGCGMISDIYLQNITTLFSSVLEAYACADINDDACAKRAEQYRIKAMSVGDLIASPEIDIILNLTVPTAHFDISKRSLLAGKHVYSEKPLAISLEDGKELVTLAKEKGLLISAAPDTFLGGGLQTCRHLIENGEIGIPIAAQGLMLAQGPESFHLNPEFFYKAGAGPLLDMGPYYFTALTALFGPAKRVTGFASATCPTRTVMNKNSSNYQSQFQCEVDTFISGIVEYSCGVIANVTTTWDLSFSYWDSGMPLLTVFGSKGTLSLPDPNTFGGIGVSPMSDPGAFVKLRIGSGGLEDIPLRYGYTDNSRGLGLADMAWCVRNGGTPRVSGECSLHVLEMMLGILESSKSGKHYVMETSCLQPEPLYDNVPFR